jgi:hypothetical protein
MTDHDKKVLDLKLAAQDVSERALIAYYTEKRFHRDSLADSVERLKEAIAEYEKESK